MSLSDESAANATNGKHPPTPFNIDGEPITYDGNPAHVEGILHELSEWTARTGHYVTLLENNAVLLANGKMAVDSVAAVLFVSGEKDDGGSYSFHAPCPATSERIKKFDAPGGAHIERHLHRAVEDAASAASDRPSGGCRTLFSRPTRPVQSSGALKHGFGGHFAPPACP